MSSYPYQITVDYDFSSNRNIEDYNIEVPLSHRENVEIKNDILTLRNYAYVSTQAPFIEPRKKYRITLKDVLGNGFFSQASNDFGSFERAKKENVVIEHKMIPQDESDNSNPVKLFFHASPYISFSGYEIEELVD